jgi:circadian clock protein KaiB
MRRKSKPKRAKSTKALSSKWDLRLYVADNTKKSTEALRNLKLLCEAHLAGRYHITVIDLVKNPQLAQGEQILALPALVRKLPMPIRKVVGDLSDAERVLVGLNLCVRAAEPLSAGNGK